MHGVFPACLLEPRRLNTRVGPRAIERASPKTTRRSAAASKKNDSAVLSRRATIDLAEVRFYACEQSCFTVRSAAAINTPPASLGWDRGHDLCAPVFDMRNHGVVAPISSTPPQDRTCEPAPVARPATRTPSTMAQYSGRQTCGLASAPKDRPSWDIEDRRGVCDDPAGSHGGPRIQQRSRRWPRADPRGDRRRLV